MYSCNQGHANEQVTMTRNQNISSARNAVFVSGSESSDSESDLGNIALRARQSSKKSTIANPRDSVVTSASPRPVPSLPQKKSKVETPGERRERLIRMRNKRLADAGEVAKSTSSLSAEFFDPAVLIAQNRAEQPSREQALQERQAEAQRKQESRERAFRKAQKGRAIPVQRSFYAPRSAVRAKEERRRRNKRAVTPTVDFGSPSNSENERENESESQDEQEWDVEAIVGHRVLEDGVTEYEVKWENYDSGDNTWEPEENLANSRLKLEDYLRNHVPQREEAAPTVPMMGT